MLLGEPPRTPYDLNFVLAGVPVRVHPLFWLIMAVFGYPISDGKPLPLLLWIAAAFLSILVHEFGHVMAFRYFGVSSHVVLYSFGGLAVPHSGSVRGSWPSIMVSLAGPMAGFALAATLILGLRLSGIEAGLERDPDYGIWFDLPVFTPINLFRIMWFLLFMNIFWGLINLLPVYPLDGGQAARALLTHFNPYEGVRQSLMLSILTGAGLAIYAYVKLDEVYMALMFGYLAYMSYATLQAYSGRGGFG